MTLEVKQLIEIDDNTLNKITNWMYDWWGRKMVILLMVGLLV